MVKFMEWVLKLVGIEVNEVATVSDRRMARMVESREARNLRREWEGR